MTTHENNGIQGAMSKKGRANLGSAFFVYLIQASRRPVISVKTISKIADYAPRVDAGFHI
jgi:hypothetical protein